MVQVYLPYWEVQGTSYWLHDGEPACKGLQKSWFCYDRLLSRVLTQL